MQTNKIDLDLTIEALQKSCLLGMVRKVWDMKWEKKLKLQYLGELVGVPYCAIFTKK